MENSFGPHKPGGLGYIGESSVAVVVEEMALADGSNKDVVEAVVVVIADRDAHAEERDVQSGFARHVREGAVAIVVVELQGCRAGFCEMRRWPGQSVPLTSRMSGQPSLS